MFPRSYNVKFSFLGEPVKFISTFCKNSLIKYFLKQINNEDFMKKNFKVG